MAKRKKLGSPTPNIMQGPNTRYASSRDKAPGTPPKQPPGTLYLPKLLIGHRDSAVDFYIDTLNRILDLPQDMRPSTIIISGSVANSLKNNMHTSGHESMEAQFKHVYQLLEKAIETGANVIYDISHDDRLVNHLHFTNETIEEV